MLTFAGLNITQIIMTIVVVCLFLWRMSYGMENGLFAEAAGLIAVIAAFFAVYYSINLVNNIITVNLGNVLPKIGYLVVAFAVYKIMTALADALRRIKNIPIIGNVDRFLGAVIGIIEAIMIIILIEYATDIEIKEPVLATFTQLFGWIEKILKK